MLTILTATTKRPHLFALLERYVERQSYAGPLQWLVCGENLHGYHFTKGQELISRPASPLHSVCANYLAMLPHVTGQKILCVEDDDAYLPGYFDVMSKALDEKPLVGLVPAHYYHVPTRRYHVLGNRHWASLAATGMTRDVLPTFEQGLRHAGTPYVDGWLWCHWSQTLQRPHLLLPNERLQIGLKGLTDDGVGTGHTERLPHEDADGSVFRTWLGQAANWYVPTLL